MHRREEDVQAHKTSCNWGVRSEVLRRSGGPSARRVTWVVFWTHVRTTSVFAPCKTPALKGDVSIVGRITEE